MSHVLGLSIRTASALTAEARWTQRKTISAAFSAFFAAHLVKMTHFVQDFPKPFSSLRPSRLCGRLNLPTWLRLRRAEPLRFIGHSVLIAALPH